MAKDFYHIIQACIKGDREAQYSLYKQHSDRMLNVAYRIMNNREDARDILQEAYVKAFKNLHTFKFDAGFETWLKRIVINTALTQLKKKGIPTVYNLDKVDTWYSESESNNSQDWTDANIQMVKKALMQLPNGYRTVLSLYLIEGYDHSEIAEILGIKKSTSLTQYKRGKEKLKLVIKQMNQNAEY